MNPCRDLDPQLVQYADGETDAESRTRIEAHLATCAACSAAVAEYRQSLQRVTAVYASGTPPEPFVVPARPAWRIGRIALATATASIIAALGIGYAATRHHEAPAVHVAEDTVSRADVDALLQRMAQLESQVAAFEAAQLELARARDRQKAADAESVAAISVAAGIFLEERQGDVAEAERRYRYAADHFGETRAGQDARDRLDRIQKSRTNESST